MRVTLWLPIVVLAVGALSVLLVRDQVGGRSGQPAGADASAVPVGG